MNSPHHSKILGLNFENSPSEALKVTQFKQIDTKVTPVQIVSEKHLNFGNHFKKHLQSNILEMELGDREEEIEFLKLENLKLREELD